MNTPSWVLALFIAAAAAQIIACETSLRRGRLWLALGFIALIIVTGLSLYPTEEGYGKRSLSEKTVTLNPGSLDVDTFLGALSLGEYKVTMDPSVAHELKQRGVKIKTSAYQDVPFPYVLDHVLIPQLPGPQQWEYEVIGKTIRIKRRWLQ